METEQIQSLIETKFKKIEPIPERSILRAELIPNGKPAAIYYFDYNSDNISYDLKEYQENLLANDYYNHPGYLQWNYYLIFLRDKYSDDLKRKVEGDDIYTRKYLFKPAEFKEFLANKKSETVVQKDIVIEWKEKLKAVDLVDVYTNSKYTEAIERFIKNEVQETSVAEDKTELELGGGKIDFLYSLKLKADYRKYPEVREYTFGKVNLLSGVNGVGKTSLLEAIENVICGDTLRNPEKKDKTRSIEAQYNSEKTEDIFTPSSLAKYRDRDREWYNNDYRSKNYLILSFNRYNFYNSDTAFNIDKNNGDDTLIKYLTRIAVGSEFGRVRDRLMGFRDRLYPYFKNYQEDLARCKNNITQANEILKDSKNKKQIEDYFNVFIETCKQNFWLKPLPGSFDDLPIFEKNLNEAANLINNISRLLPTSILKNMKSWSQEIENIEAAIKNFESLSSAQSLLQNEKKEINKLQISIKEKVILINDAEIYFSNIESFKLEGLDQQIFKLKIQFETHKKLHDSFIKIDTSDLKEQKSKIDFRNKDLIEKITEATNEKNNLEFKVVNLRKSLSLLQNLSLEIKNKGREYLAANSHATQCPLCESEFKTSNSLAERINHVVSHISESLQIENIEKELQITQERIKYFEKEKKIITGLLSIASQFYSIEKYTDYLIDKVITDFKTLEKTIQQDETELTSKSNFKSKLNNEGFDENSFNEIKNNFKKYFEQFNFNEKGLKEFLDLKEKLDVESKNIEERERNNIKAIKDNDESFEKIAIESFGTKIGKHETQEKLVERKQLCEQALSYYKLLLSYFKFNQSEDVSVLNLRLENIQSSLSTSKDSRLQIEKRQIAEKLKSSAEEEVKDLTPKIERLDRALKVIDEIIKNDTEEKVLKEFIDLNSDSIDEIFSSIHTPHEFKKVKIDGSEISLTRKNDDTDNPVSMISSGQRSALALSIFLTLNRQLKNGPNIILFDDPVVFTDDLNVLSFLDYLRELVINEGKQIFFATANKKLAGLFEKKFSFLNEADFKNITLIRN